MPSVQLEKLMLNQEIQALAIAFASLWVLSGLLAISGHRGWAATTNAICATIIFVFCAFPFVQMVFNQEQFIAQRGRAALAELPLTAIFLLLSVVSIVLSTISFRRGGFVFFFGWILNVPVVVFVLYLAFWFKLF